MNCIWEEIEQPDARGYRRVRCTVCGRTTNPTLHPLERIFAPCRAHPQPEMSQAQRDALAAAMTKRLQSRPAPTFQQQHPEACQHRGPELRREECQTCQGHTQIKVFACPLKGECTIAKQLPDVTCCRTCDRFESAVISREIDR